MPHATRTTRKDFLSVLDFDAADLERCLDLAARLKLERRLFYSLFATEPSVMSTPKTQQRYLFGGSVYDGWTTVPDKFKVDDPQRPDPNRSTAVIFRFAW